MATEATAERNFPRWYLDEPAGRPWGWMLAAGIVTCVLGVLAIGAAGLATLATIILLGALLLVGGIMNLLQAFRAHRWQTFLMHMLLGVFYSVAGILFLYAPIAAAVGLTLLLAVLLFASGITRLAVAFADRVSGWVWLATSGVASIVLGLIVLANWPFASIFLIGLFIGFELLFGGAALISVALSTRKQDFKQPPPLRAEREERRPTPPMTPGQPSA